MPSDTRRCRAYRVPDPGVRRNGRPLQAADRGVHCSCAASDVTYCRAGAQSTTRDRPPHQKIAIAKTGSRPSVPHRPHPARPASPRGPSRVQGSLPTAAHSFIIRPSCPPGGPRSPVLSASCQPLACTVWHACSALGAALAVEWPLECASPAIHPCNLGLAEPGDASFIELAADSSSWPARRRGPSESINRRASRVTFDSRPYAAPWPW